MSSSVTYSSDGPVCVLTLNRPERHNSLTPPFLQELLTAIRTIQNDPAARVVLLRAEGRTFSTGGDLRGFYDHLDSIAAYAGEVVGLLNRVILEMVEFPIPVVTAVHGIVTGGSLGLILASDLVLVSPKATFTPYYSVVGFSPDGGWTAMLPMIIGPKRAAEILMTNATISAREAVSWGLANRLIPADEIQVAALETAWDIASKQAGSIYQTKRLLWSSQMDLAARLEDERTRFVQQIQTQATVDSMSTFLEAMR